MKIFRILLASLLMASAAAANDYGTAVSNVSVKICGAPGRIGTAFATGTVYAAGTRVFSNGGIFFNPRAGTSGVTNPLSGGGDFFDGSMIWRSCLPENRAGFILWNLTAGNVYLSWVARAATTNSSGAIAQGGVFGLTGIECPQGDISVISEAGRTNDVRITEW